MSSGEWVIYDGMILNIIFTTGIAVMFYFIGYREGKKVRNKKPQNAFDKLYNEVNDAVKADKEDV